MAGSQERRKCLSRAQPVSAPRLDALLQAGKPELTLEALILQPRYKSLFTDAELLEARARLGDFQKASAEAVSERERLYPDELEPGVTYPEGAKKQVRINAFERNSQARKACLVHYGTRCAACDLSFDERYGDVGAGFIHVHHIVPLTKLPAGYRISPITDLVPVCPNCHAMLHRTEPPLTVAELRQRLSAAG